MKLVVFDVSGHVCGVPATAIREVLRAVAVTPLPGAPAGVEGVIDMRGELVPVLDLRARFELPKRDVRLSDVMIVASTRRAGAIALKADAAFGLTDIADAEIASVPEVGPGVRFATALARRPDEPLVVVYDVDRFFEDGEAASLEKALAAVRSAP